MELLSYTYISADTDLQKAWIWKKEKRVQQTEQSVSLCKRQSQEWWRTCSPYEHCTFNRTARFLSTEERIFGNSAWTVASKNLWPKNKQKKEACLHMVPPFWCKPFFAKTMLSLVLALQLRKGSLLVFIISVIVYRVAVVYQDQEEHQLEMWRVHRACKGQETGTQRKYKETLFMVTAKIFCELFHNREYSK